MRRYLLIFTILIALISCSESAEHKNNIGNAECVDETNCEKTSSKADEPQPQYPIILPGAPGENSKLITPKEASNIASTKYVKADVDFLQGMIVHHQQAIVMSQMAEKRTNNKTIIDLADRIDSSQEDEINFMRSWLESREELSEMSHSPINI